MKSGILFQAFEWYLPDDGKYYQDMLTKIDDLKELGITAVWLPPFCKATGINDTGYGIYDLWDLGEFSQKGSVRTKYGKKEELINLINTYQKNGILVYADIVLNHKAGADRTERFEVIEVDENDRNQPISDVFEIEGWTAFDFENRHNKYSDFKWSYHHFSGIDYDNLNNKSGVYKIIGENKGWGLAVSMEKGNFDYLMFADIDHAHPDVVEELKKWIMWLIEELNLDGLRFDALKHIDNFFMKEYLNYINDKTDEDFYMFGEYWENSAQLNDEYLTAIDYTLPLFDTVLHFNLYQASYNSEFDLRTIFDNSLVLNHPHLAVTFVDNHDSQPYQALESFVDAWFKEIAYGLILLRKDGYPCIFYGDYYGIENIEVSQDLKSKINKLAKIRNQLTHGDQDDYFNFKTCVGWVRNGNETHPYKSAVLISSKGMDSLKMFVGLDQTNLVYIDYTGNNDGQVIIDEDGYGNFLVSPASISVWAKKGIDL